MNPPQTLENVRLSYRLLNAISTKNFNTISLASDTWPLEQVDSDSSRICASSPGAAFYRSLTSTPSLHSDSCDAGLGKRALCSLVASK